MFEPTTSMVLECLDDALQTMAFICLEPASGQVNPPGQAEVLSIHLGGQGGSDLELAVPPGFGQVLAANILALEPGSAEAMQGALDAVKELCNVTAGTLLNRMYDASSDVPEMSLPQAKASLDAKGWQGFVAQAGTAVVVAEGYPLAVRLA